MSNAIPHNHDAADIRRRVAHILDTRFNYEDALSWPKHHPIDLDSMDMVELAMHLEDEFHVDLRDDLIPHSATVGDFVDMVVSARNKASAVTRGHFSKKPTMSF